jgi:hypothetical protein
MADGMEVAAQRVILRMASHGMSEFEKMDKRHLGPEEVAEARGKFREDLERVMGATPSPGSDLSWIVQSMYAAMKESESVLGYGDMEHHQRVNAELHKLMSKLKTDWKGADRIILEELPGIVASLPQYLREELVHAMEAKGIKLPPGWAAKVKEGHSPVAVAPLPAC